MKRREVISKCMEMGVPIFNGRIDKTLFVSSMRRVDSAARTRRQPSRLIAFAETSLLTSGGHGPPGQSVQRKEKH